MKKDRNLPAGMYLKHGAYWLVRRNKWHRLGTELPECLQAYAQHVRSAAGTLPGLLDRFLLRAKGKVAANTYASYASAARRLQKHLAEFSPHNLKPTTVAQLLDHYRAQPSVANQLRTVLKGSMDIAVREGLADANPCTSIPPLKAPARERYITDAEFWKIAESAEPLVQAVMRLQYLTGQRVGDVLGIRHTDITEAGIAFRQQKTGKLLIVSAPGLDEAIVEAKALRKVRGFFLFLNSHGRKLTYRVYYGMFKEAAEKAGIVDARPNDLRAKSATDAEEQGINPTHLLGHDSADTTKTYLRNRKAKVVAGPRLKKQSS
jgi:integrase